MPTPEFIDFWCRDCSGSQRVSCAFGLIERNDAQSRPQLMQGAEHCGFRQFLAEFFLNLARRQYAAAFEQLPDVSDQRRNTIGARRPWCVLPVAIAAQRVDKGQRLDAHQKIGMVTRGAEQVERQRRVRLNQSREQILRVSIAVRGGVGLVSPRQASTNDGAGAGICAFRGRKRQRPVCDEPGLRVIEGEQRLGLLPPERRACRQ